MDKNEKSAIGIINNYIKKLSETGFKLTEPQKRGYAYFSEISDSKAKVVLQVYFGKKGNKIVLQGNKEEKLYKDIYSIIFGEKLFDEENTDLTEPNEYIGIDESGKGDFFGPLVAAGVFVNKQTIKALKNIGVRDSKLLSDTSIKTIAEKVKLILKENFNIVFISPEKYNQLYEKMGNTNLILGWAHAKVLENLLQHCNAQEAISDKFGNEKVIRNALQEKGREIILHQKTKAERYTAVAAASILARESVINWFEVNSSKTGVKLPKGASAQVEEAAKNLNKKIDADTFRKLIKLHFKTSKRIFNN